MSLGKWHIAQCCIQKYGGIISGGQCKTCNLNCSIMQIVKMNIDKCNSNIDGHCLSYLVPYTHNMKHTNKYKKGFLLIRSRKFALLWSCVELF
jgi:hypothetical protein